MDKNPYSRRPSAFRGLSRLALEKSSLPILAATLLTREPCIVHRVPDLSEHALHAANFDPSRRASGTRSGTVTVAAETCNRSRLTMSCAKCALRLRARPLLGRCKEADRYRCRAVASLAIANRFASERIRGAGAAVRVEGGNIKVFARNCAAR